MSCNFSFHETRTTAVAVQRGYDSVTATYRRCAAGQLRRLRTTRKIPTTVPGRLSRVLLSVFVFRVARCQTRVVKQLKYCFRRERVADVQLRTKTLSVNEQTRKKQRRSERRTGWRKNYTPPHKRRNTYITLMFERKTVLKNCFDAVV